MRYIKYCISIVLIFFLSCNKTESTAPAGYVYITVGLGSIAYRNLAYTGGHYFFEYNTDGEGSIAGVNGVLVYSAEAWKYYNALECTCPLDTCPLTYDKEMFPELKCECCNSTFSGLDGSCFEGEAKGKVLRWYNTSVDRGYLYVRN
ncbi:hypothetical protein LJC16_00150 [Bacteroidales bacterium OttesenSCG-928-C19]|nr:hypothetical protein [Bacteroidales bacterium OttesenSCG-928-C19]